MFSSTFSPMGMYFCIIRLCNRGGLSFLNASQPVGKRNLSKFMFLVVDKGDEPVGKIPIPFSYL